MRLPRWKKEQKQRHLKPAVFLFFLAVVLFLGFFLIKSLKSSRLPKDSRATVVFAGQSIQVISFEPKGELTIVTLPEKTYLEVTRGFGSYRLGAVWDLGEKRQKNSGGQLLAETLQEFLGIPVDGWIKMANGSEKWWTNFEKLQTNLTIFDLAKVWFELKFTRSDKVHFLDLEKTPALSPLVLADGSKALTVDLNLVDRAHSGLFKDNQIVSEHFALEILNGTDKVGLANRVSRLITNLGGDVIRLNNSREKIDQCQIKTKAKFRLSFTAKRLAQIFACQIKTDDTDSRFDLQITIGEDYWRRLFSNTD